MTLMLMILLGSFLGAALLLTLVLQNLERQKWMRMFSEKQGIPVNIMDGRPDKSEAVPVAVPRRHKFAVPIPGADWMRKNP